MTENSGRPNFPRFARGTGKTAAGGRHEDADYDNLADRTVCVSNLSPQVSYALIYELFIQIGPVESVSTVARQSCYVLFMYSDCVPYAVGCLCGLKLYNQTIELSPLKDSIHARCRNIYLDMLFENHMLHTVSAGQWNGNVAQYLTLAPPPPVQLYANAANQKPNAYRRNDDQRR